MRKSLILSLFTLSFLLSTNVFSQKIDTVQIFFDINSYSISGESLNSLNQLIAKPNLRDVKIFAYTDFLGSFDYNQKLSEIRAKSVRDFLVSKGLAQSKILSFAGMGIHQFSSFENRRNENDRGIREHRMVEIVFTCDGGIEPKLQQIVEVENDIPVAEETKPVIIDLKQISEKDLVEGNKILLKNINFEGGSPVFLESSDEALEDLFSVMREHPELKIEIQGHICCQPSTDPDGYDIINDNNFLSENRARAVFEFLRDNGIDASRMTYRGFAATQKLYPDENTSWEQTQNRRVEIKIVSN
jgi:outer membrane protein OmpA-like peptidoglycan-associated protein